MNIPFYFDVLCPNMVIYRHQSIGYLPLEEDLSDRKTFVKYFQAAFKDYPVNWKHHYPWIDNFHEIYIQIYNHTITMKEIFS